MKSSNTSTLTQRFKILQKKYNSKREFLKRISSLKDYRDSISFCKINFRTTGLLYEKLFLIWTQTMMDS